MLTIKVAWSEELYRILNVTGKVPLSYELYLSKVHPDDRDYVDKEWKAALKSGVFDVKYRVLVDHTITWVHAKAELESNEQGIFTGGFGTVQDITEQRKSFQELKMNEKRLKILNENLENIVIQRTKQVRVLSKALTLAEQRERKRFSYILHENLQQQLLGAGLLLQQHLADHRKTGEDKTPDDVADGLELINNALQTTKMLSIELNPPILSSEGLDQALEWLIRHMKENYGLQVAFHSEGDIKKVKNETQLMLTQMVRELLTNVIGHSGVHSARLEAICKDKTMQITVSDQGRGFNPEEVFTEETGKNHLGLISIRERLHLFGGELLIESMVNKGTHVVITIPVEGCR